jgi:hypothetical protein
VFGADLQQRRALDPWCDKQWNPGEIELVK